MNDDNLVIKPHVEEEEERAAPLFTVASAAYAVTEEGGSDEMDFRFEARTPIKNLNVMDWLTFLFLTRNKMETLYSNALEQSVIAYCELRDGVGADIAKIDIESYLATRVAQDYEDENTAGLREIEYED